MAQDRDKWQSVLYVIIEQSGTIKYGYILTPEDLLASQEVLRSMALLVDKDNNI